jgi:hypothetical protein
MVLYTLPTSPPPLVNRPSTATFLKQAEDAEQHQTGGGGLPQRDMDVMSVDDGLQDHVLRVQQTLLEAVDRQVSSLGDKLAQKEHEVKRVSEEKEQVAVSLYRAGREVLKLNDVLAKV